MDSGGTSFDFSSGKKKLVTKTNNSFIKSSNQLKKNRFNVQLIDIDIYDIKKIVWF